MAENGETSGSKPSQEIWAKLVPSHSKDSDIDLNSDETIVSSVDKTGWCKVMRNSDQCSATVRNTSSNALLVNDSILQSGDTAVLKCGSEIILLPDSSEEGNLSYTFKLMAAEEGSKTLVEISVDVEHAKCSICLTIWHDVVTAAPCLHNFCNGCFSEWLKRSQEKHSSVLCPQCRAVVQFVGRNHFLHNIEEDILKSDPSLKRTNEEFALLDSYALIKSPLVLNTKRGRQRKRQHSPSPSPSFEESAVPELFCPQCGSQHGGFQCNQNTIHLQCQACGGMMPSRTDINVPQHCVGCERAFCGVYWQSHSVTSTNSHPVCSPDTLKRISARSIARIPPSAHENNRHEQEITERCIRQTGRTLANVISEWVTKFNNREIDRANMPLKHAVTMTAETHICNDCYDRFVSFLLYWYRVSSPKSALPADVSQREDCWYGYRCRTQHHSEDHARKRNHVCRPTRGSIS